MAVQTYTPQSNIVTTLDQSAPCSTGFRSSSLEKRPVCPWSTRALLWEIFVHTTVAFPAELLKRKHPEPLQSSPVQCLVLGFENLPLWKVSSLPERIMLRVFPWLRGTTVTGWHKSTFISQRQGHLWTSLSQHGLKNQFNLHVHYAGIWGKYFTKTQDVHSEWLYCILMFKALQPSESVSLPMADEWNHSDKT